jgi:hypothetical protein
VVCEQPEQALDARPGAAQVLGRRGIVERLVCGDQELFVRSEQDGLEAAGRLDAAIAGSHAPERDAARRRSSRA